MKALTVNEPYASMIRCGYKHNETRSWKCPDKYIGQRIIIHAGKNFYKFESEAEENRLWNYIYKKGDDKYRKGVFHCSAIIKECIPITEEYIQTLSETERMCGFYEVGRYAWVLEDVHPFDLDAQVVVKGKLGLWEV